MSTAAAPAAAADPPPYAAPAGPPRAGGAMIRLSVMMFLQYAVWGLWLPILAKYLGTGTAAGGLAFTGVQVGWILGLAGSVGAVASPFIAGQLADRVMNAERALGLLLILGGVVQAVMTWQTSYPAWLMLSICYSVLYMPTLALTNSVAFANLPDPARQFPPVRTWGTIGWIVASVAFPLCAMVTNVHFVGYWPFVAGVDRPDAVGQMKYAMLTSGLISVAYGLYCVVALPQTPPKRDAADRLAFAGAFRLLTSRNVVALLVAALLISMIHQLYFIRTPAFLTDRVGLPSSAIGPTMAIGQVSEICFLAILGLILKRVGFKTIIAIGALSYALRYACFSLFPSPVAVKLAMFLHGMNYGFFFAGAYLFVERIAAADIRHSAQTAFGIIILGLGPVLAGFYNELLERYVTVNWTFLPMGSTTSRNHVFDYRAFWLIQAGLAALALVILLLAFPGRVDVEEKRGFPVGEPVR